MKWFSVKTHAPHYKGYYLVSIHDDGEPDGEPGENQYFDIIEWNGDWVSHWLDDDCQVTNFCPIEPPEY